MSPPCTHCLVGLVVKVTALRAKDPGVRIRLATRFFRVESFQWLSCHAPGITGSALGLVGPVSVYCDWVR